MYSRQEDGPAGRKCRHRTSGTESGVFTKQTLFQLNFVGQDLIRDADALEAINGDACKLQNKTTQHITRV